MTNERSFEAASRQVFVAMGAVNELPRSLGREYARDNLEAAIGWIKQARDEWATKEAAK